MRSFFAIALLLGAGLALAQPNPPVIPRPYPQLTKFLELTPAQVVSMQMIAADYNLFSLQKQTRMAQVQFEISDETQKERLDAMALGLRYLEIEAICRELKGKAAESRRRINALFTDRQKARVQTLEEAYHLMPVVAEAVSGNVLPAAPVEPLLSMPGGDRWFDTTGFRLPAFTAPGCVVSPGPFISGGIIRVPMP